MKHREKKIFIDQPYREVISTPYIARRQIISYPLVTTLNGFALKNMLESVQQIINTYGFCIPPEIFIFPFIFFITIFRFLIGNILHLRSLEEHKTHAIIWLYDLLVITLESMLLILMSFFIYEHDKNFLPTLMLLCIVDTLWVFSMFPHWRRKQRPEMPWAWGMINLVSFLILFTMIFAHVPFAPLSVVGRYTILAVFLVAACLDLTLDYYKIFRSTP